MSRQRPFTYVTNLAVGSRHNRIVGRRAFPPGIPKERTYRRSGEHERKTGPDEPDGKYHNPGCGDRQSNRYALRRDSKKRSYAGR
jgi:hypothetical protein